MPELLIRLARELRAAVASFDPALSTGADCAVLVDEWDDVDFGERRGHTSAASARRCVVTRGDLRHYVKFRSAMFRNSIAKSSISDAKIFTRFVSML